MNNREISEKRFRILFSLLRVRVPLCVEKVSILYKLFIVIATFSSYSISVAVALDAIDHREDLHRAMVSTRIFFAMNDYIWCATYISLYRESIERLLRFTEQFTWEELPTKDPDTGDTTMAGWINKIQVMANSFKICITATHICLTIYGMMTKRQLVFFAWYPFDTTISPNYELTIIFQSFCSYIILNELAGIVALYGVIVSVACSQMEKMRLSLLNLKQNEDIEKQLNESVRHHQLTLEYINEIENLMSMFHCGLMLSLLCGLCITAFSTVTSWGHPDQVIQGFAAYLIQLSHVFVICWFGTKLIDKAESVREGAWECNWVGAPISFQKSIMLIMARANKTITLTASKFVPLSNETLSNILNESLSLFMFLLHVKDRNEDTIEDTHVDTQYILET